DRALREQLGLFLRELLHETQIPAIYVTHDQEEAFAIADRLVLLHEGQVEQDGTPDQVYNHPASVWAARFLGLSNVLSGQVMGRQPLVVHTELGDFKPQNSDREITSQQVTLLFRPSGARQGGAAKGSNTLSGTVEDVAFRGETYRITLRAAEDTQFQFYLDDPLPLHQTVTLALDPDEMIVLKSE
ncbi:TOBE domain-containing protein, partial [bacterium]|nr:TOBE domain-containing protein [bacterium]